jgi:hypothetical protein
VVLDGARTQEETGTDHLNTVDDGGADVFGAAEEFIIGLLTGEYRRFFFTYAQTV